MPGLPTEALTAGGAILFVALSLWLAILTGRLAPMRELRDRDRQITDRERRIEKLEAALEKRDEQIAKLLMSAETSAKALQALERVARESR